MEKTLRTSVLHVGCTTVFLLAIVAVFSVRESRAAPSPGETVAERAGARRQSSDRSKQELSRVHAAALLRMLSFASRLPVGQEGNALDNLLKSSFERRIRIPRDEEDDGGDDSEEDDSAATSDKVSSNDDDDTWHPEAEIDAPTIPADRSSRAADQEETPEASKPTAGTPSEAPAQSSSCEVSDEDDDECTRKEISLLGKNIQSMAQKAALTEQEVRKSMKQLNRILDLQEGLDADAEDDDNHQQRMNSRILKAQEEIFVSGLQLQCNTSDLDDNDATPQERKEVTVFHHETDNIAVYAADVKPPPDGEDKHSFFIADWPTEAAAPNRMHQIYPTGNMVFKSRAVRGNVCEQNLSRSMAKMAICLPPGLTRVQQPSNNAGFVRLFFAAYYKTGLFPDSGLLDSGSSMKIYYLNSSVIAASVGNSTMDNLSKPVQILFSPLERDETPICAFWNFSLANGTGAWSTKGCWLAAQTDDHITCECNHLTNFALLSDVAPGKIRHTNDHGTALTAITYVGCCLSLVAILMFFVCYASLRWLRQEMSSRLLFQFCLALFLLNVFFLAAASPSARSPSCAFLSVMTHYALLCVFFWTFVQSVHLYRHVVDVFSMAISKFFFKACIFAWGTPAIIVFITMASNEFNMAAYSSQESTHDYCRLRRLEFLIAAFVPLVIILILNCFAFVAILRIIFKRLPHGKRATKLSDLKRQARLSLATFSLLGLTWLVGVLMVGYRHVALHYVFAILNSLLGLTIIILNIGMRDRVRKTFIQMWREASFYHNKPTPDNRRPSKANLLQSGGQTSHFMVTVNTVVQGRDALQPISQNATKPMSASSRPACIIHCNQTTQQQINKGKS